LKVGLKVGLKASVNGESDAVGPAPSHGAGQVVKWL